MFTLATSIGDVGDVGEYLGDVGEYVGDVGEYAGDVGEYAGNVGEYVYVGDGGQYFGDTGKYAGDVGEYAGDVGEYAGDVGEYAGDVGEYVGYVGEYTRDGPISIVRGLGLGLRGRIALTSKSVLECPSGGGIPIMSLASVDRRASICLLRRPFTRVAELRRELLPKQAFPNTLPSEFVC